MEKYTHQSVEAKKTIFFMSSPSSFVCIFSISYFYSKTKKLKISCTLKNPTLLVPMNFYYKKKPWKGITTKSLWTKKENQSNIQKKTMIKNIGTGQKKNTSRWQTVFLYCVVHVDDPFFFSQIFCVDNKNYKKHMTTLYSTCKKIQFGRN